MPYHSNRHRYTLALAYTYTHTHTHARIHTPTYTHTHVEETHHNNTKTIHPPTVNKQYKPATPEPPQHQPYRHPQNFYLIPRPKPLPSNQSLYHSTKASVSYSLPPAHRTAPLLYAAALKPAQHRSCIGTLYQEQNNPNNPNIISKNLKHHRHVSNQDTTTNRHTGVHEYLLY